MTFDTQSTPIWKIPFPAVTICPQSKSNHSIFKLTNFFMKKKFKKSERKSLYALAHVCDYDDMLLHDLEYPVTKSSVLNDLKKISLNLEEVIYRTKFTGLWKSDDSEFYEMFTNEGICYSFNLLDYKYLFNSNIDTTQKMPKHNGRYENATKWCLQDGYEDYNVDSYPYRAMLSGVDAGLSLELKSLADDIDTICGNTVDGFKIALHTPGEFPRFEKHFFQIPFGQNLMLSVKPQVITTSENLNLYSPQKRQCYFDGEKRLKYFKMYSQSNCEFECLTEYTKAICGCVKFSMPHSKDTRVCNTATDIDCYRLTNSYFYIQHINDVLKDTEQEDKNKKQIPNHFDEYYIGELELENVNETYIKLKSYSSENRCNCLPACTSLQYDAEISQNLLNVDIVMMNGFENK